HQGGFLMFSSKHASSQIELGRIHVPIRLIIVWGKYNHVTKYGECHLFNGLLTASLSGLDTD
ncbi:hypothetical protein ACQKI4_33360, partial [Paenibacillus glucanolyticus]|uniref:hypothetical protein n=1 Tax=Paenibacillus glucanolyticus TaxID=59843 RepID=UPI003D063BE9